MTTKISVPRPSEFALIEKLFAPLAAAEPGAYGLKDDAAVLSLEAGHEMVLTVDTIVEGVHFLRDDPADLVAQKALRVNLSDLAAKGVAPRGYLLALSLSPWVNEAWLKAFAGGLRADQEKFGIALLGGDTTATYGALSLTITATGSVPEGAMLRRAGARPGDLAFVTGTIGDAGAGLEILRGGGGMLAPEQREALAQRYRVPQPRTALGARLRGVATATLDVSDGLMADLGHIAELSGVRIVLDATKIPLSSALVAFWGPGDDAVAKAATAGDDYEVAFTAPETAREAVAKIARETLIPIAEVGRVETGMGVVLIGRTGQAIPVARHGFTHF
jgi:thiamine-monophosphate kinase